ncbi:toll/interleukin-1 receptor domain-containing protein [bacterium]|nr:MAG: toll/interleukin-1 receptor domain-containing protein [bacterium]
MLIQLTNTGSKPKPKRVFYSYSHKDEDLKEKLDEQLTILKRDGFISTWDDRMIRPGEEWDRVIDENLNLADIIMLLISPAFMASEYCQDIEVKRAVKRHDEGTARVIPIILKPIVWSDTPFAKLEALPSKGRPISCWTEIDEAFKDIVEKIRVTIIEVEFPRSLAGDNAGLTGQWLLRLQNKSSGQNGFLPEIVVNKMKEMTKDYSIKLLGVAHEQIADGEKISIGHVLILSGSSDAYEKIHNWFINNELSEMLGLVVTEFHISYGSTIQTSSVLYQGETVGENKDYDLLFETEEFTPVIIRGIHIPKDNAAHLSFVIDSGNVDQTTALHQKEFNKVIDYFKTALAVKEEHLWVNLSAFESNRMLPKELEGTVMGRDLLDQDCLLKRFTASLLHPDHYIGRQYWNKVYQKSEELFGTSEIPLNTYQKVWVFPKHAEVYEGSGAEILPELRAFFPNVVIQPSDQIGFLVESELDVKTETDLFAINHTIANPDSRFNLINEFTLALFQELVLPVIKKEVNFGRHFSSLRQMYHSMVLACWAKSLSDISDDLKVYIDTNDPKNSTLTFEHIQSVNLNSSPENPLSTFDEELKEWGKKQIDHVDPGNQAFKIRENREFYEEYIKMYRNGIYRCARTHTINGKKTIRMYFSGALDFTRVSCVIKNPSVYKVPEGA